MNQLPTDRQYLKSHEWVKREGDTIIVGITDHAQESLGDLVFVELPEVGDTLAAGETCAVVESVKAASDIYAPVDGEVLEVNEELEDSPELINDDPHEGGWLMRLSIADESALDDMLDADAYQAVVDEEG